MDKSNPSDTKVIKVKVARPAHLHRMSAADVARARGVLDLACLVLEPEDRTQRQEFSMLLPKIYILREMNGYTFKQITALLIKIGIKLKESSVRVYYAQMLPNREDECIHNMAEHIRLYDSLMEKIKAAEIAERGETAFEIMKKNLLQKDL